MAQVDLTSAEWADVTPIYGGDHEDAVVQIAYTQRFREIFAYLRALIADGEKSERALRLTTDAVDLNPANYTLWQYRRDVLSSLGSDLRAELEFCTSVINANPKNYQVWHHRRTLVEWLNDASGEHAFIANVLREEEDAKNYHAWQHRVWVCNAFDMWTDEVAFTSELIAEDMRNNSAWNHRFYAVVNTSTFDAEGVCERECKFAMDYITKAINNESPWNYLRGIASVVDVDKLPGIVWAFCERQYAEQKHQSHHLLAFMLFMLTERAEKMADAGEAQDALKRCVQLTDELMECDPVRQAYWRHRQREVQTCMVK